MAMTRGIFVYVVSLDGHRVGIYDASHLFIEHIS